MDAKEYLPEPRRISKGDNSITLEYKTIVGIQDRTIIGLDKVFHHRAFPERDDDGLHGATHTGMVAVSEEQYENRLERWRDHNESPVAHIYDEQSPEESWDEWIGDVLKYDAPDVVVDMARSHYWDAGIEIADEHLGVDAEFIECISGGRMTSTLHNEWDVVFRPDLIALAKDAESYHPSWVNTLSLAGDAE